MVMTMINDIDIASYLIQLQCEEYYKAFSELSQSQPDDPTTSMVECDKKAYSFDKLADLYLGATCPHKLCSADALYIEQGIKKDKLYIIEFKTGFKDKISDDNFDEQLMTCKKLDPPRLCEEYKKIFFKKREKEKEVLIASLHEKATESYILLCHSLFPQCEETQKQYQLIFAAVIDDVNNDPIEAIERVYDDLTEPEKSDNPVTESKISLKKYMAKDTSGNPIMYDKAFVWSVEYFNEIIGKNE